MQVLDKDFRLNWKMPEKQECFLGREQEVKELERIFECGNKIVFLQGVGGIGKSGIATEYVLRNRGVYDCIVYAQYASDLKALVASDVEIPIENVRRNTLDEYYIESENEYFERKFAILKSIVTENTLIIIDNFNNQEESDLDEFLKLNAKMLFISRFDWSIKKYPVLNVKEIQNTNDIKKIFYHYYMPNSIEEEKAIEEIIQMVSGYTLAVEWIAKQLSERTISAVQMLDTLKKRNATIVSSEKEESLFGKLVDVFQMDVLSEEEKEILRYMCFVPYTGISKEELVRRGEAGAHIAVLKLLRSSWLRQISLDVVTLHPVVAEAIRYELNPNWINCNRFIKSVQKDLLDEDLGLEEIERVLKLSENIFETLGMDDYRAVDLLLAVSHVFMKRYHKFDMALGILEKASALQEEKMEHIRTKISLCKQQDVMDLEYNDLKNSLLEEEKIRCNIMCDIGRIRFYSGAYDKALTCFMKVSKSPVADVYCDIAKIYAKVNECQKAIEYVNAGIKMKIQKYGENSVPLIENYLLMVEINNQIMDRRMALKWLDEANKIAKQKMTEEEQSRFYYEYALLLKRMNMVKEALEYDQKTYISRSRLYGENHIEVAKAYAAMAVDYYRLGDYVSALECTLHEVKIRKALRRVKKKLFVSVSRLMNKVDVDELPVETKKLVNEFMTDFNRLMKENPKEGQELLRQ